MFELQDLGSKDLKGIVGPGRAWAALRPALVESRFEALHADGLTELVGREEELELILRRWAGRRLPFLRPYMPATAAKVDGFHCRRSATPIVGAVAPS